MTGIKSKRAAPIREDGPQNDGFGVGEVIF